MTGAAVQLQSARLHIRHAYTDDIPAILAYYTKNKHHLLPFEPLKPASFYTAEYWGNALPQRLTETEADRSLKLFIFPHDSACEVIGALNFSNFVRGVFQACTVGYSLAYACQGQGYMSEAMHAGINHMFSQRQFHRIGANYIPYNQRSAALLKRLGFVIEGYARDYLYINGRWQDHVLTSLTNPTVKPVI
ncbi:MAG: GNAT family N-acetyltransferase [Phormidesmis sp.]